MELFSAACVWMMISLTGCDTGAGMRDGGGAVESEETMEAVIRRVNENSAKMDFVLRGVGHADGRYRRSDGKTEPFHEDAKLLYRKPRNLYLELEHSLGEDIMQVGSNDREFWVWKKVQDDRYWWGEHDQLDPHEYADLPIRPDQLVDVIGLGNLPTAVDAKSGPLFQALSDRYQLTFLDSNNGTPYQSKQVFIDRRPPNLIREVVYLTPSGRQHTLAKLMDYRYVRGAAVMVPYRVRVEWPGRGEFLELDFSKIERHEGREVSRLFTSPRARRADIGEEIRVDRKPAPSASAGDAAGGR